MSWAKHMASTCQVWGCWAFSTTVSPRTRLLSVQFLHPLPRRKQVQQNSLFKLSLIFHKKGVLMGSPQRRWEQGRLWFSLPLPQGFYIVLLNWMLVTHISLSSFSSGLLASLSSWADRIAHLVMLLRYICRFTPKALRSGASTPVYCISKNDQIHLVQLFMEGTSLFSFPLKFRCLSFRTKKIQQEWNYTACADSLYY